MLFHNRLILPEPVSETAARIPFHQLKEGDRFQHTPEGKVSQVIRKEADYMTVKRHDDWLLHMAEGCYVWDKMVIKVAQELK